MPIQEHMLANRLKIIVQSDHRAPVVVSQIWYKVGSADEPLGLTGLSHALEHMMFKGTPRVPNDGYSEQISKNGGNNNAFTTDDFTAYYAELEASKLALSFELEADRMLNLSLKAEDFIQEKKVIKEERRMRTDDNPQSLTFEAYKASANPKGPYHHPIIGWMKDIDNMSIEDLKNWYKTWYRPDNAIVVVVGDVKAQAVFKLAEQYFGPLKNPSLELPKRPVVVESPLKARCVTVKAPANLPFLIMGFDVPAFTPKGPLAWQPYALALASVALDGGESARFSKHLIRQKNIAAGASTHYELFKRYPSQFDISAIPKEGVSMKRLEEALWQEIEALKTYLLPEQELKKIKAQLLANEVFQKDAMSQQATMIGEYEAIGLSFKEADNFIKRINLITAEQIQQVMQTYFIQDRLTIAILKPQALL